MKMRSGPRRDAPRCVRWRRRGVGAAISSFPFFLSLAFDVIHSVLSEDQGMGEFDSHRDEATGGLLHTNKLVLQGCCINVNTPQGQL